MTLLEKGTCSLALFTNLKQNLKFCKFLLMVSLKNFGILFYQHIKTHQRVQSMLKNVGLFDHKKFQEFSKISAKFQYFPGLFSNSKTFQDCWEPWEFITHNKTSNKYELFATVHTQKEEGEKDLAKFILSCSTKIIELTVSLRKTIRGCFWKNPET